MSVSVFHLLEQGPALRALSGAALSSVLQKKQPGAVPALPAAWIEADLPPRSAALITDYVRNVGGDPSAYRGIVPAHFFSQWSFPLLSKQMQNLPYPITKIINAGCRIEIKTPLPAGQPLHVKARLESIDDDGRRVLMTQKIVTGTAKVPVAIVAELRTIVPLPRKKEANGAKPAPKALPRVPSDAKEIAFFRLRADAGLDFAKLTGDINPIHWIKPAAKAAGFRACILHGFGTLARAVEALNRRVFAGDVRQLAAIDVRFTRPLVLPAEVGVYITHTAEGGNVWVGDAPGGGAYLEGRFDVKGSTNVL